MVDMITAGASKTPISALQYFAANWMGERRALMIRNPGGDFATLSLYLQHDRISINGIEYTGANTPTCTD
jgi:hypothetical protein